MLKFLSLMAGAAMALTTTAYAQDYPSTNIRFGHSVSQTSTSSLADDWVSQEIEKRSNGQVKLQMFWAGAAGSPAEIYDLVSTGALDAAAVTPSWFAANLPFFAPLSSAPFTFKDSEHAQRVAKSLYAEIPALAAEAEANNIHVMRFALFNEYHLLCTQPLRTIEDFKGRKVRSQGDYFPIVLNELGATPVTVLPGEFYEAMQRGTIDCIILPYDFLVSNRLYEVAKYASDVTFGPIIAHMSVMNRGTWDGLDPSVQELITTVQAEAEAYDVEVTKAANDKALATLLENGVELIEFAQQEELQAMMPDMLDVWAEKMNAAGRGEEAAAMAAAWRAVE
jgi:TRAP-type C4-dicarboxylate transport system substrate-binding protein